MRHGWVLETESLALNALHPSCPSSLLSSLPSLPPFHPAERNANLVHTHNILYIQHLYNMLQIFASVLNDVKSGTDGMQLK